MGLSTASIHESTPFTGRRAGADNTNNMIHSAKYWGYSARKQEEKQAEKAEMLWHIESKRNANRYSA